ncbi:MULTISPECIES: MarR family winged helix-turn-helix transcriptional regulator [Streptosporangium]|uniref:DNA-binding MarR family transcriptional regulator n=1 Tax=Streptosporangium brasiliense TaxID=47480 RepID=A0ABT9RMG5_9ACTN|nr:MarR family transcriptional regulator [Streptosporangium brasiliense]MDP9869495.1 DNA-binding MarR family transcriptional regulator [Streptosporangium brasiliense]
MSDQRREAVDEESGPLRGTIGHLLRRAFTGIAAEAMRDGPQSRDFVVLDVLADENARSQQDLAHRLGVNRTIMVKLLDRLQQAGHLTRTRNPANRRTYVLSLTDAGRTALEGMRQAVADRDAQLTAALTTPERHRLNELLSRLIAHDEQPTIPSTEHLIAQAHYRLRRLGDHKLEDYGLRTRHFGLLPALERLGPCPQQQLARYLHLTEPATASLVEELVQAGLVVRGQDPHDRRRYALELTGLGRARIPVVRDAMQGVEHDIEEILGPDGTADLRDLLTKLLSRAGQQESS